ncbi:MAG: CYTH domain-containing protein [Nanoarchaeota archaeon]|nr:CYTH domain-containing protein [Nanoarchaeota archaeon]
MDIEVELRSFITKEQFDKFIELFKQNGKLVKEDNQETYYFNAKEDLRIQKNDFFSKIWMKKGKIHDEAREEIEIKCAKEDFDKLERLFLNAGFDVNIKWFRKRHEFEWEGITVCLDYTRGYGYIIEFEKMSTEDEKDNALAMLKEKFASLGIEITPREEFDKKFKEYKENWRELIKI